MTKPCLPKTDSIKELADFWDAHDLTDFQGELEEVAGPVFAPGGAPAGSSTAPSPDIAISVPLRRGEVDALERMARSDGISSEELLRRWVVQQIAARGRAS